jgi:hypothetical protein
MTPDKMRARSQQKVAQVTDLMTLLHLRHECKEKLSPEGFIEKVVFWVDDEPYPSIAPEAAGVEAQEGSQPAKEEEAVSETQDAGEAS